MDHFPDLQKSLSSIMIFPRSKASSLQTMCSSKVAIETSDPVVVEKVDPIVVEKVDPVIADCLKDFKQALVQSQSLLYYSPKILNGEPVVAPPQEAFEKGEHQWQNAVVVQVLGKAPNFSFFHHMVNKLWGRDGNVEICPVNASMFVVQLPNPLARDRVLESESWHIQNKPLLIRKWTPRIKPIDINLKKVPLWIHLKDVPLELFNREGLSYIASVIGKPLYMDSVTASCKSLAYAKVCVEIETEQEIPTSVKLLMRDGSISLVMVDIPWYPTKCSVCNLFGHTVKTCVKTVKKVWQDKKVSGIENLPSFGASSLTLDQNGDCPKQLVDTLPSPAPQGNNGIVSHMPDVVLPSPVVLGISNQNENGYSSNLKGSQLKNVDEMMNLLVLSKVAQKIINDSVSASKTAKTNQYEILSKLADDASLINEVLSVDDDINVTNVEVVADEVFLVAPRRGRAAAAGGVKTAVQCVQGNKRRSKSKKVAGNSASNHSASRSR